MRVDRAQRHINKQNNWYSRQQGPCRQFYDDPKVGKESDLNNLANKVIHNTVGLLEAATGLQKCP